MPPVPSERPSSSKGGAHPRKDAVAEISGSLLSSIARAGLSQPSDRRNVISGEVGWHCRLRILAEPVGCPRREDLAGVQRPDGGALRSTPPDRPGTTCRRLPGSQRSSRVSPCGPLDSSKSTG